MRLVLSVIVGVIAGGLTITILQLLMGMISPPPTDLDMQDREAMSQYIQSLSVGELLVVVASHSFGTTVGAFVCSLIARRKFLLGWLLIGGFFFLGGILNDIVMMDHPTWFVVTDLIMYFPIALAGGFLGLKLTRNASPDQKPSKA